MADEIVYCRCGFKQVKSSLAKSSGLCPKCGKDHPSGKEYRSVA